MPPETKDNYSSLLWVCQIFIILIPTKRFCPQLITPYPICQKNEKPLNHRFLCDTSARLGKICFLLKEKI